MTQPGQAGLSLANIAKAYKDIFNDRKTEQIGFKPTDLWRWLPKKMDFYGGPKSGSGGFFDTIVKYAGPQARISKFDVAQTHSGLATGVSKVARFSSLRRVYYGVVTLDEESTIAASRDVGAFFRTGQEEIRDVIKGVVQDAERYLWGDGSGSLATVGSISTTTITLAQASDTINFEVGMNIAFATNSDGSSPTGADAGSIGTTVTAIDSDAGTVETSIDVSDDAAPVIATNFIFKASSASTDPTAGDAGGVVFEGLSSWIPLTAESAGTFLGQSRVDAVQELQGFRQTAQGDIEETIKKLHTQMARRGRRPDTIWLSWDNWHELEVELGTRAVRDDGKPATFGLPSLKYSSPGGLISIMPGAFCPNDRGYLLTRKSWMFHHMEGAPHVAVYGGQRTQPMPNLDSVELRVRIWGNLVCHEPFDNGVFAVPSST